MKIKLLFMLMLMVGIAFSFSAQDASFYKKYADKGDKEAMYNLADCYINGTGGAPQDMNQATYWLTKSAKKNYAPAQVKLAYCYIYGAGVLKDYKQAWDLAQKAMKQGEPTAHYLIATMYKDGIYVPQSWSKWQQYIRSAANLGNDDAQADLGVAYLYGVQEAGIQQDINSSIPWLRKAAEQGDAKGNFYLGVCYEYGAGVPKDEEKALEYYYTAANAGQAQAQCEVAMAYLLGKNGLNVNYPEAYKYVNAAIEQEEPRAYKIMGDIYYYGLGTTEDNDKAAEWYKKASDAGNIAASTQLAEMYIHGVGVPKNESKAYQLYKTAADADDMNGLGGVGVCFENGFGVAKNIPTAVSYYKKAAEKGHDYSTYRLYLLYRDGNGVSKDTNLAIQYLRQAADNGDNDAIYRLGLEYWTGEILHEEPATAIKYMKQAAENGMNFAAGVLGTIYYNGYGAEDKDYNKAFEYLSQAVRSPEDFGENLLSEIYRDLAACYRFGRGTEVNHSLASYYTEQAAKYGDEGSFDAVKALRNN